MLLMFVVGMGNLALMLALAAGDGRREEPAMGPAPAPAARSGAARGAAAVVAANV